MRNFTIRPEFEKRKEKILHLKTEISEIKNPIDGFNSRLSEREK